jgi:two-component system, NarL family, sensor histidine kinase UhpB
VAPNDPRTRLLAQIETFDEIRHLRIVLADGERETPLGAAAERSAESSAPAWFVRLVEPPAMEFRRPVGSAADPAASRAEIVVRTDPADEITESWVDARSVLGLVLAFAIVANAVFFVAVGRWLRPLERVVHALDGIEKGDYAARLPSFDLPELSLLARKFNHMAEVLERSRDENRELTQRSLAIQEGERRFLAQELHDELGQSVSAIKAVAVSIGQTQDGRDAAVASAASTIADVAGHVYSVVTGMIRRLRPVRLDEFGLVPAIEELVDGWNERNPDAFCSLSIHGRLDGLGDAIDINLYRIVQESLTNVGKHARATEVHVELDRDENEPGGCVRLEIRDNGIGFDPDRTRRGLGLLGISERAEALNGTLRLEAAAGRGVAVRVAVPLEAREAA